MKRFIISILAFFFLIKCYGQESLDTTSILQLDELSETSEPNYSRKPNASDSLHRIEAREIDRNTLEATARDAKIDFSNIKPPSFFLSDLIQRLWDYLSDLFWVKQENRLLFRNLVYIFTAIGVVYILVKLWGIDIKGLIYKKGKTLSISKLIEEENIHELNFEEEISKAIGAQDYRRAVRLHYLRLLKNMTQANLIVWKADKTNHEYEAEITDKEQQKHFKRATYLFEYVYYGDFVLAADTFENIQKEFVELERYFHFQHKEVKN